MQTKRETQKKQHSHWWSTAASGKRVEEKSHFVKCFRLSFLGRRRRWTSRCIVFCPYWVCSRWRFRCSFHSSSIRLVIFSLTYRRAYSLVINDEARSSLGSSIYSTKREKKWSGLWQDKIRIVSCFETSWNNIEHSNSKKNVDVYIYIYIYIYMYTLVDVDVYTPCW